ncbi:hypothetical protein GCM10022384_29830 [Streptomyces marokkonensis]|uniref:Uncharacterized protein n=1 Tax=Streptomyces marokkonensis TaxID=324855 RepID=A0ABP7QB49_9ACTN
MPLQEAPQQAEAEEAGGTGEGDVHDRGSPGSRHAEADGSIRFRTTDSPTHIPTPPPRTRRTHIEHSDRWRGKARPHPPILILVGITPVRELTN